MTAPRPTESSAAPVEFDFDIESLGELRQRVTGAAAAAGLSETRAGDLVIAAAELGANSVAHGGGSGTARIWSEAGSIFVETRDSGRIESPEELGHTRPDPTQEHGRGIYIARELCDEVQITSSESGTTVRLRLAIG